MTSPRPPLRGRRACSLVASLLFLAVRPLLAADGSLPVVRIGLPMPQGTEKAHEPLANHLATSPKLKVEIVPFADSRELENAFLKQKVDLAYVGALTYVDLRSKSKIVPVIAEGAPVKCVIAVPSASKIAKLEQLRGKLLALTYEGSTTGHAVPLLLLARAGVKPANVVRGRKPTGTEAVFFDFVGAPEKVVESVLSGEFAAGAMYDAIFEKNRDRLRSIAASGPLPGAVLAGHAGMPELQIVELRRLFGSYRPPSGTPVHAFSHGSRPVADADYAEVQEAAKAVLGTKER